MSALNCGAAFESILMDYLTNIMARCVERTIQVICAFGESKSALLLVASKCGV